MIELIFSQVSLKLHLNLINITGEFLSFDQLKKEVKIYLLTSVLEEIKKFLINPTPQKKLGKKPMKIVIVIC